MGDTAAERLEAEANLVGPTLESRRHTLFVARPSTD
jgi:hypothetical protein